MFGCASSNDSMNDTTAMDDNVTMSETQTMAGTDDMSSESSMSTTASMEASANILTYNDIISAGEGTIDYDDMFSNISDTKQHDALALIKMDPNLSTFAKLLEQAELEDDLQRLDEYTLFVPTNQAFAQLDQEKLQSLLLPENKAKLMHVLQAHVLPGEVSSLQLENNTRIQMSENSHIPVEVGVNNTNITVGGAQLVRSNIEASNGTIHVIDGVILPENAREDDATGY
ncbi:hypothetical protein PKOR_02060 [Pontibacter korlensis]|uniref:FAS1 domain-containing protein n=2 Tax=Pontibacter korlensis TaxID=400092 RepID=A0A0E3UYU6_9BACT|nr:hypothetical protein PKOR_02060 [Pontibacter korlensis]